MTTRARLAGAVIGGAVLWAVLWVGGAALAQQLWPELLAPGRRLEHTGALLGYIAYSIVVSLVAGYVTARVGAGSMRAVQTLAVIQLALGIVIEGAGWQLTPVWYHVAFLALLAPAIVLGGRLYGGAAAGIGHDGVVTVLSEHAS